MIVEGLKDKLVSFIQRDKTEVRETDSFDHQLLIGEMPDLSSGRFGEAETGLPPGSRTNLEIFGQELLSDKPSLLEGAEKNGQDIALVHTGRGVKVLYGTGIAAAVVSGAIIGKVIYNHLHEKPKRPNHITQSREHPLRSLLVGGPKSLIEKVVSSVRRMARND
ncbi:hypothetical protein HYS93_00350 [Candidatus Daviesbacteria bacterium]|nr:hypothetical protein [Candidatus Daviesbacteria bacterium]